MPSPYPTYHVGDRVIVRQWDDMESEFGLKYGSINVPKHFTKDMKKYCGQTFPIVRIRRYTPPNFDSYDLGGSTAVFSSPMFEQSKPQSVPPSSLSFDDLLQGATL